MYRNSCLTYARLNRKSIIFVNCYSYIIICKSSQKFIFRLFGYYLHLSTGSNFNWYPFQKSETLSVDFNILNSPFPTE